MSWFTGTSTGDKYEVGERYQSANGDVKVAQANGTFVNERTGQVTAGSYYGNGHATFSSEATASGDRPAFYTDAGKPIYTRPAEAGLEAGSGSGSRTMGPVQTAGPGVGRARLDPMPEGGPRRTALRVPGTVVDVPWGTMESPPSDAFLRRFDGPIPQANPLYQGGKSFPFLGIPFELNPNVPSAQAIEDELGEAELLSPGWFANWAAVGGHIDWNVQRSADYINRNGGQEVGDAIKNAPEAFADAVRGAPAAMEKAAGSVFERRMPTSRAGLR